MAGRGDGLLVGLAPDAFEAWVGERFRELGYDVQVTSFQGDHGVDLLLTRPGGEKIVVQCKHHPRSTIGEPVLRDLFGAMHHLGAHAGFLVTTGQISKAAREWLRWPDTDLGKRRLQVRQQLTIIPGQPWQLTRPKSRSGRRTIPLIPAASSALEAQHGRVIEYRRACPAPWPIHDLVFRDALGEPLVGRRVERVFKQHLNRAGLPTTFTPHSLRHSTATYLTAMEVPSRVIMEIMGHSSLTMTTRYQHVMEGMLDLACDKLAAIFPSASR
jgi:hypothetical protein